MGLKGFYKQAERIKINEDTSDGDTSMRVTFSTFPSLHLSDIFLDQVRSSLGPLSP